MNEGPDDDSTNNGASSGAQDDRARLLICGLAGDMKETRRLLDTGADPTALSSDDLDLIEAAGFAHIVSVIRDAVPGWHTGQNARRGAEEARAAEQLRQRLEQDRAAVFSPALQERGNRMAKRFRKKLPPAAQKLS